jgi:DNA-binding IclR family transcriptional regulator
MSQTEVLAWLKAHPGAHSTKDLMAATGLTYSPVCHNLHHLRKWKLVEYETRGRSKYWAAIEE